MTDRQRLEHTPGKTTTIRLNYAPLLKPAEDIVKSSWRLDRDGHALKDHKQGKQTASVKVHGLTPNCEYVLTHEIVTNRDRIIIREFWLRTLLPDVAAAAEPEPKVTVDAN